MQGVWRESPQIAWILLPWSTKAWWSTIAIDKKTFSHSLPSNEKSFFLNKEAFSWRREMNVEKDRENYSVKAYGVKGEEILFSWEWVWFESQKRATGQRWCDCACPILYKIINTNQMSCKLSARIRDIFCMLEWWHCSFI